MLRMLIDWLCESEADAQLRAAYKRVGRGKGRKGDHRLVQRDVDQNHRERRHVRLTDGRDVDV